MTDRNQIRINELARELEVKAKAIIDYLPEAGVTEKKTHSSSIEVAAAEKVRKHFRDLADAEAAAEAKGGRRQGGQGSGGKSGAPEARCAAAPPPPAHAAAPPAPAAAVRLQLPPPAAPAPSRRLRQPATPPAAPPAVPPKPRAGSPLRRPAARSGSATGCRQAALRVPPAAPAQPARQRRLAAPAARGRAPARTAMRAARTGRRQACAVGRAPSSCAGDSRCGSQAELESAAPGARVNPPRRRGRGQRRGPASHRQDFRRVRAPGAPGQPFQGVPGSPCPARPGAPRPGGRPAPLLPPDRRRPRRSPASRSMSASLRRARGPRWRSASKKASASCIRFAPASASGRAAHRAD